jgi:hypothetical protein
VQELAVHVCSAFVESFEVVHLGLVAGEAVTSAVLFLFHLVLWKNDLGGEAF